MEKGKTGNRSSGIVKVSIKGIIANIFLVGAKALVGFLAGSISIILDALNNLTDALSSIITIVGTKLALKKPDKKHPYGHGRIEYITSIIIAVIIIAAGIGAGIESVNKIIEPTEPTYEVYSFIIIIMAIVVKILLGLYFRKKGKDYRSESLKASGTDALMDSILSFTTLIAMIVNVAFGKTIEGYLGILIAIFILKAGIEIIIETVSVIIGERFDPEQVKKIKDLVNSFEEVRGVYDVVLHNYGPEYAIGSLHIEVDDKLTAQDIHKLSSRIAGKVYETFGIVVTVGIYATNNTDDLSNEVRKDVVDIISNYPDIIQMHGFYVDQKEHTIMFDIILKFETKSPSGTRNEIVDALKEKYPEYQITINLDTDFSD